MKTYLDCIPCFMNQALRAGRLATSDTTKHKALLDYTAELIKTLNLEKSPAENGAEIYHKVREITGIYDPYKAIKRNSIREAQQLYAKVKTIVNSADNPLLMAVRAAIAGNVIDFGIDKTFDIQSDLNKILYQDFAILDFDAFAQSVSKAKTILYLADNAGESVFDKLLIETINKPVIYVTREVPVINDVTIDDALASGIDDVAKIISSGTSAPGIILSLCNKKFVSLFNKTDMIISKGQGNFEGLSDADGNIFFLLKAKCPVIAKALNVRVNDIILKQKLKNEDI